MSLSGIFVNNGFAHILHDAAKLKTSKDLEANIPRAISTLSQYRLAVGCPAVVVSCVVVGCLVLTSIVVSCAPRCALLWKGLINLERWVGARRGRETKSREEARCIKKTHRTALLASLHPEFHPFSFNSCILTHARLALSSPRSQLVFSLSLSLSSHSNTNTLVLFLANCFSVV
ncbi:hypothetical protein AAZV13_04G123900 [Glycine max]|uniref:Uncharacterized protein n=1 Tax=Glycine soja TaxID=3848 RepID=A0A0B2PSL3_GLYSO|nr:hypothetical protein JHK87_010151 [Glycine soja]KAG5049462.1 hypothetical protein JHK85_010565 [Glycine max]KAG5066555.1 hypothetical protein JHK86_010286 [Glycine max]KHN12080.1 hypothetical protein glysoja_047299 [Glycine soja]